MSLTQEQKTEILSIKAPVVDARDQRIIDLTSALKMCLSCLEEIQEKYGFPFEINRAREVLARKI